MSFTVAASGVMSPQPKAPAAKAPCPVAYSSKLTSPQGAWDPTTTSLPRVWASCSQACQLGSA